MSKIKTQKTIKEKRKQISNVYVVGQRLRRRKIKRVLEAIHTVCCTSAPNTKKCTLCLSVDKISSDIRPRKPYRFSSLSNISFFFRFFLFYSSKAFPVTRLFIESETVSCSVFSFHFHTVWVLYAIHIAMHTYLTNGFGGLLCGWCFMLRCLHAQTLYMYRCGWCFYTYI